MDYSLPKDFENRMKEYLLDEYDDFIKSYEKPEVKGIRFSGLKVLDLEKMSESIKEMLSGAKNIPWIDDALCYETDSSSFRPGKHPYHEAGAYYIQEPSAMSPAVYLDARPFDRVLDLCAAPGGKSTQIAAMMEGKGILISNEIMPDRAKILSENIERMGVRNALVISEDPRNISDKFAGYFDKILVDAPCSGEGMFRRSDIAVNEWSIENVGICAERQAWILDEASKMLAPGGRLVYSTCTFSKEEDEESVKGFLTRHDDFEIEEMKIYDGMRPGFDGVGVRIWPHLSNGEGHYMCSLRKKSAIASLEGEDLNISSSYSSGESSGESLDESLDSNGNNFIKKIMPPCGYQLDISKKDRLDLKEMFNFIKENITDIELNENSLKERRFVKFKDQIYMLPKDCPSLTGIKVLRPGLHMGTILKNRFEPAHALAMSLRKDYVKQTCELTLHNNEGDLIYKYLRGETYNYNENNGWYLILADDYSLGWGKLANNTMKNHYPKGLRKNLV